MSFVDLTALATHLRQELQTKKCVLLYAYNGTGKTRLSTEFKNLGKQRVTGPLRMEDGGLLLTEDGGTIGVDFTRRDTLYFNAFTEDLFAWDNDLANDRKRVLRINRDSAFFAGLDQLEMDNRIRPLLSRYVDFDFRIDTTAWEVSFSREVVIGQGAAATTEVVEDIKVSRGEENIFIWCFFLAIVQLAMDDDGSGPYGWVKHVYIDDPISSLDEHNAITVANHLAQMLRSESNRLRTVISTHHPLFFNVLCNEFKRANKYFLSRNGSGEYTLRETGDTPFFHHVAALAELVQADQDDRLYTHHFNMLRSVMEKTAGFHGHKNFSACIRQDDDDDEDALLYTRLINIMSHGNYSLYEPQEMLDQNKRYFRKILHEFIQRYPFNPELFPGLPANGTP